jgi:hypothetical protein
MAARNDGEKNIAGRCGLQEYFFILFPLFII